MKISTNVTYIEWRQVLEASVNIVIEHISSLMDNCNNPVVRTTISCLILYHAHGESDECRNLSRLMI